MKKTNKPGKTGAAKKESTKVKSIPRNVHKGNGVHENISRLENNIHEMHMSLEKVHARLKALEFEQTRRTK